MSTNASLKIAIVSTQEKWYGGEEVAYLLARGLRREGHRVQILARHGGAFAQRMAAEGFDIARFARNGRNPLGLWQVRRFLRRMHPDVLVYNDSHAVTAAGMASWGLKIPVRVAIRHVAWPIRSSRRFLAFCDRVVCVSNGVADACRGVGLPSEMLRVVFAATDPERVRSGNRDQGRMAAGVDAHQTMILVVAGLNENKGHRFLLEAMPAVLRRHADVRLVLAGDGPLREPLEAKARRLGIDAQVGFLGYRRDVPDLTQAADLVVLPSLVEGFGLTLVDAMFAGVPIVTTDTGGVPDVTGCYEPRSEPTAWVVPPRDSLSLAEAIIEALDTPNERARRADCARQRAERLFTPERMVEASLAVYREALRQSD